MDNFLSVIWNFDPVLFNLGGIEVRYYGLTWALAFGISMVVFINIIKREGYSDKMFDSIFWHTVLATIIGARLGHCLFYDFGHYMTHPIEILNLRQGGLASHGAAVGILLGLWMFSRKNKMPYIWSLDRIMIAVAISGATIRFGNLFNSEIYGVETSMPWGFIFVRNAETVAKHPTQIYEALCCLVLFAALLWLYYKQDMGRKYPGFMFGLGVTGIFLSRFFIEYIKNPQEEFESNMSLLMGQWLSIPFIILGVVMMVLALQHKFKATPSPASQPQPQQPSLKKKR